MLRDGERVVTDAASAFDRDAIIRAMVGRSLSGELYGQAGATRQVRKRGAKVLSVQNLSMGAMVRNTSFSIFAGQVTGIFGLIGSGRTETAKILSGVVKRDFFHGGEVLMGGRKLPLPGAAPGGAGRHRLRDRGPQARGLLRDDVDRREHPHGPDGGRALAGERWSSGRRCARRADQWTTALKVRAINGDARVIELSGGNQQKVVIAKTLAQTPRVVVFDEPTRGVDVGAIAEIHQLINRLADDGPGGGGDLVLPAGDPEPVRPHPGRAPGPHRRGVHGDGGDRGADHVCGGALTGRRPSRVQGIS